MLISKQNELELSKVCSTQYECDCGSEHGVTTKNILVGTDVTAKFFDILGGFAPLGSKILFVCDQSVWEMYGNAMCHRLLRLGYRIAKAVFEDEFLPTLPFAYKVPDDTALVLAVGGGCVVDTAKYIAQPKKLPVFVYGTSLFANNALAPSAFVQKNGFFELVKTNPPVAIVCDTKNFATYSALETCYAIAKYCGNCMAIFDWYLLSVVEHTKYCKNIANQILDSGAELVRELYNYLAGEIDLQKLQKSLCEKNIRLGVLCQCLGDSRLVCGSPTIAAMSIKMADKHAPFFACELNANKRLGEMYAECIIDATTTKAEFVPPPDNHKRSEQISKLLGVQSIYNYTKIAPYFGRSHIEACTRKIASHKSILLSVLQTQNVMFESVVIILKKVKEQHKNVSWGSSTNERTHYKDIPVMLLNSLVALSPDVHLKPTALSIFKQLSTLEKFV
ncbi:MAG: iron-containing alcohol dehydrogenase [Firmicutes bacterium]|nr:iron-containing alcohol dehydrogenase [Bacillota bacterium]